MTVIFGRVECRVFSDELARCCHCHLMISVLHKGIYHRSNSIAHEFANVYSTVDYVTMDTVVVM